MDAKTRKRTLLHMGCFFSLASFGMAFVLVERYGLSYDLVIWCVVGPLLGLYQLLNYSQGKDMDFIMWNAGPEEKDKRRALAILSISLTIFPVLLALIRLT